MSERFGLNDFDKTSKHSFENSCTQGISIDEHLFASFGIKRQTTSEGTETSYPNGVSVDRHKEGDFEIHYPANLKHHETAQGLSTVSDKHRKVSAYLSAEGNLLIPYGDSVLQEDKNGAVSLNDVGCFDTEKSPVKKHTLHVIQLPPVEITVHANAEMRLESPAKPHEHSKGGSHNGSNHAKGNDHKRGGLDGKKNHKDNQKSDTKPFNWDSDDPLEGVDTSGY